MSHHVHHYISEKPGDPYNVHAGWWYCFLADVIHQPIAKDLSEQDYHRVCHMVSHTGIRMNRYDQYQQWGSVCHPIYTILHFSLNWAFWYAAFYGMGGHALATAAIWKRGSLGVWGPYIQLRRSWEWKRQTSRWNRFPSSGLVDQSSVARSDYRRMAQQSPPLSQWGTGRVFALSIRPRVAVYFGLFKNRCREYL